MANYLRFGFTLLILSCWLANGLAQKKPGKNDLLFFFSPEISKTNFESHIQKGPHAFTDEFLQTAKPSLPIFSYSIGLVYCRILGRKSHLVLKVRHNMYGQASPYTYNYRNSIPPDTLEGYGGMKYKIQMWSNGLSLGYAHSLGSWSTWKIKLGGQIGFDFYRKAIIKDYIIRKDIGVHNQGCCTGVYYKTPSFPFMHDSIRLETGFFGSFQKHLSHNWVLNIEPELRVLSDYLSPSGVIREFTPNGTIYAGGINLGLGYSF
ncbi:MAG: hypothetical protein R2792_03525 [Saprospiraceae bacterium]